MKMLRTPVPHNLVIFPLLVCVRMVIKPPDEQQSVGYTAIKSY